MTTTEDVWTETIDLTGRPVAEGWLPAGTEITPRRVRIARRLLRWTARELGWGPAQVGAARVSLRPGHGWLANERGPAWAWQQAGVDLGLTPEEVVAGREAERSP